MLGCDTMQVGRNLPTYPRKFLLHPHYSNVSMGAAGFFKVFINFYQTSQRYIPQGHVLDSYCLESLESLYYLQVNFSLQDTVILWRIAKVAQPEGQLAVE